MPADRPGRRVHITAATRRAALCFGFVFAACSPDARFGAEAATLGLSAAAAAAVATPPPAAGPCRLLSDADVRAVFPGATAGTSDPAREKYGISVCVWSTQPGQLAAQRRTARPGSATSELREMWEGFTSSKPAARNSVRIETVAAVGDQAVAIVEPRNDKLGLSIDLAILIAMRGDQLVELQSSNLAQRDRAAALRALATLGRAAVGRL